ncbi:unnamed protein product [Urochloa humidicola]
MASTVFALIHLDPWRPPQYWVNMLKSSSSQGPGSSRGQTHCQCWCFRPVLLCGDCFSCVHTYSLWRSCALAVIIPPQVYAGFFFGTIFSLSIIVQLEGAFIQHR